MRKLALGHDLCHWLIATSKVSGIEVQRLGFTDRPTSVPEEPFAMHILRLHHDSLDVLGCHEMSLLAGTSLARQAVHSGRLGAKGL